MKRFRIQIPVQEERARGLVAMVQRGRVICLRDEQFIVPEPALALLDELGVTYTTIGEETADSVARALRDSVTASI